MSRLGDWVGVACTYLGCDQAVEQRPELGPPDGWRYFENDGWYCPDCAPDLEHQVVMGILLPHDLERVLRDPTISVPRDHEIKLADGRTLWEHLQEWRNAPSNTASAD